MNPPEPTALAESPSAAAPADRRFRPPRIPSTVVDNLFRFQSLFGLVAVFLMAVALSPRRDGQTVFLSPGNLANLVGAVSEIGIIAVGMTFVILIGGIDLSVGAMLGLAAVGSAVLMVESDWGFLPSVLVVLLIGLVFGALQGMATA